MAGNEVRIKMKIKRGQRTEGGGRWSVLGSRTDGDQKPDDGGQRSVDGEVFRESQKLKIN